MLQLPRVQGGAASGLGEPVLRDMQAGEEFMNTLKQIGAWLFWAAVTCVVYIVILPLVVIALMVGCLATPDYPDIDEI